MQWLVLCALSKSGKPICFSQDTDMRLGKTLGDGNGDWPASIPPLVDIQLGEEHVCARDELGSVWCWGKNSFGQCGHGDLGGSVDPHRVDLPSPVAKLAVGRGATCALLTDGRVSCWGANLNNQLGRGPDEATPTADTAPHPDPAFAVGVTDATDIAMGETDRVCVVRLGGEVWCWGAIDDYHDGVSIGDGPQTVPVAKRDPLYAGVAERVFRASTVGTCITTKGGKVYSWSGLGMVNIFGHIVPKYFPGPEDQPWMGLVEPVAHCSGSFYMWVFLRRDGRLAVHGTNTLGSAGLGAKEPLWIPAAVVPGLDCASVLADQSAQSCVIRTNGQLWCWGAPFVMKTSPSEYYSPAFAVDLREFP